jgi:autotransporter-associated beta strand protein
MNRYPLNIIAPLLGSIAALVPARAVDVVKLNNTSALNLAGAWSGGTIPSASDVMVWNNSFTAVAPRTVGALSSLGADFSIAGIKVTNPGGALNAATTAVGFQNAGSTNTLTLGASGFDLSAATQTFYMESKLLVSANQSWVINNANTNGNPTGFGNGEDLAFRAMTAASATTANTAFNLGGFSVNTSGTGAVTVSSGYFVSNGTINIGNPLFLMGGGDTRAVIVSNDVNLNVAAGSTLHFQSNSGITTSSAAIGLNGGTLKLVNNNANNQITINNTVTVNSASSILVGNTVGNGSVASTNGIVFNANLVGSANLALTTNASTASVLLLNGDNSGYSGAITIAGTAGRIVRLNTATSGSAAATWNVGTGIQLQVNGVTVSIGSLNGAGTITNFAATAGGLVVASGSLSGTITNGAGTMALTKTGSAALTLTGANSYTGATQVDGGTLNVGVGALNGTSVSVANGATFRAFGAVSGSINAPISAVGGGTVVARPEAAGVTLSVPSLDLAAGSTFLIETGTLGNPTTAALSAATFTPAAGSVIKVVGASLSAGTFPALTYSALGGAGFGGLSLSLPFRVAGSLVNNPGSVDVQINGSSKPVWAATVNGDWDIDSTGIGNQGTANWSATSGPSTYVESTTLGNDSVIFDDTAAATAVNITTAVTPGGITFSNATKNYVFTGIGRITGTSSILKSGPGVVTLANTGVNDFNGGIQITDGVIRIGDGITPSVGTIGSGAISVALPGVLELNRPDSFALANSLSGTGSLKKNQAGIATVQGAVTLGNVEIAAGELQLGGGGNISGIISGTGTFAATGGTLQLSGIDANTHSGLTTVSAGVLQLNKTGVNAIGGNLLVTGTGGLAFLQVNQIADSSTVFYDKAANGGNITISETIGALSILNGADAAAQVLANNGFVATGLASVANTGVFAIASNHAASVGGLVLSQTGVVRIAANSGASTLNVGVSGISASGGIIQIGQGTGAFDAVLNLDGDVATTGNLSITDGGFTGANLRQLNLGAVNRTFNIGAATTTTIAADISGIGGIVKTGAGTLQLTAASASN